MDSQNQELYNIILIGVLILLGVLSFFIVAIVRQQRKVYRWQQERIAAEITTLEKERKRIAGDLHDELGPILSAVRLQVNHLEPTDEIDKVILNKSSDQIDEVIKRFREISYDLLPNSLVRKGLIKAVEEFTGKMQATGNLQILFNGVAKRMEPGKEVNIYRMIQEIVHNTIKHARAKKLDITIREEDYKMIIQTKDDGVGFNYQEMQSKGGGLGLLNLQSRAEVLQGKMLVNSKPGLGTQFIIQIPIQ